ncbi:hypothetical protein [Brevundimonas sp.]|uniref:hypothetical protein n=1 Tax=Brevundimonas sp. TaxID=1871086 RepID=UPI001A34F4D8|nr:hypothetical protein [Brevundimonas sp.]MBJ7486501.1 hypothetical protein [Brevundimonas sp.]
MLSMLLLLAAAPQSAIPPMPPAPVPGGQATMRVLGQPGPGCASLAIPANDPNAGNALLWREGRDRVGHYLLLERRVNGCSVPIIVNYRVPGSNAVGREVGRAPAPSAAVVPRR